jgi:type I restriction enzyme S subunit
MHRGSSSLPQGWAEIKLPEIATLTMGQSPPSNTYNSANQGLPFFQGKSEFGDIYPTAVKYCSRPLKIARSEDILISVRAPVGPTNLRKEESCIGRGLAAIRPICGIPSRYLFYYLRSIGEWLSTQGTGSTFTAITKSDLEQINIPLAPLNEQHRIVAKLETLLSKVDACQKRLAKIPLLLKRFRQSILAAACSGRLTVDWRADNPDAAPIIMSRDTVDRHDSTGLPDTWTSVRVGSIIESLKYGTAQRCGYDKNGVPVLRIPNIGDGVIDHSDIKYADLPKREFEQLRLSPGDILLIRSNGSVSLVGKSAIVRETERDFAYAGYLIRIRTKKSLVIPEYLNIALSSYDTRLQIEIPARSTSGVHNINSDEVSALQIPLAPLSEQQEIVHRVEALFKIADQIEARYKKAQAYVDKLPQSILAKAFRGELVPQDPNDEPASILLERIRRQQPRPMEPANS